MITTRFGSPVTIVNFPSTEPPPGVPEWVEIQHEDGERRWYPTVDLRADGGSREIRETIERMREAAQQ